MIDVVHTDNAQNRDGAPAVVLRMFEKVSAVTKLWANCAFQGPEFLSKLGELGLGGLIEIVK